MDDRVILARVFEVVECTFIAGLELCMLKPEYATALWMMLERSMEKVAVENDIPFRETQGALAEVLMEIAPMESLDGS